LTLPPVTSALRAQLSLRAGQQLVRPAPRMFAVVARSPRFALHDWAAYVEVVPEGRRRTSRDS
jgi:hypothetical protein